MEVRHGRPEENAGRLEKEIRTYDLLDNLKIEYLQVDHKAAMTMEDCEKVDQMLGTTMCKNLFLCNRQKTSFYLLMMPGEKKFLTKVLSKALGTARLSFADEEFMEKYMDLTPGSVTVMGLMNDKEQKVSLVIDEEVLQDTYIGCHPCINTSSIRISTEDMMKKFLPAVGHEAVIVKLDET